MVGVARVVAVVVVVVVGVVAASTRIGDCTHNNHCGENSCCLVGHNRYSVPQCVALGGIGDYCKSHQPEAFDLFYPNDLKVTLEEAYRGLCPCRPGLLCSSRTSKCEPPRHQAPYWVVPTPNLAFYPPVSSSPELERDVEGDSRSQNSIE